MRNNCDSANNNCEVAYHPSQYGGKQTGDSLESLDLYSEMDLLDGTEQDNDQFLMQRTESKDVLDMKKGLLQEIPYIAPMRKNLGVEESSIVYRLYDIIKSTFITEYQPLTINLFQTNITEVDLHVGIDSRIPTSLMDVHRPDNNCSMTENYISRQFRLFQKDHGDTLEGDAVRAKMQNKETTTKSIKESSSMPLQLGAVTNLLNNQNWSGQTITENAFSLVKLLQSFANAEREHKMKPPEQRAQMNAKSKSLATDQQPGYFARGFFTQLNRNNVNTAPRPRHERVVPIMHNYNHRTRSENTKLRDVSSASTTSYASLGFMCR